MRSVPADVDIGDIYGLLAAQWRLAVDGLMWLPEGDGAHHWVAIEGERRWFVTVDDLDIKPWLGSDRASVFAELVRAYQTAHDLQRAAGLNFVVAPAPAVDGACAVRLTDRYSMSVFPFVHGIAGVWGGPIAPDERDRLVAILAQLHGVATSAPGRIHRVDVPARESLEQALSSLCRPWESGPLADATRKCLAEHRGLIRHWLASFDDLAADIIYSNFELVLTHGEPHPGNLIHSRDRYVLIDWDMVALVHPSETSGC